MELTGLQDNSLIEPGSLAVTGSGHCTILDFSFFREQTLSQVICVPAVDGLGFFVSRLRLDHEQS